MFPLLGAFIAEIAIPDDRSIRYERTTTSDGHYTVWGRPDDLLNLVTSVQAV
jgi:hypothetical protein